MQKSSIMTNITLTALPRMDADLGNLNYLNFTYPFFPYETRFGSYVVGVILITGLVISILGAVGNGIVIWLLGFFIKRNPFMTYILNLAVADLGVLLSFALHMLPSFVAESVFFYLFLLMNSASQLLLTAISIDRCVAVFFPLCHRCHRPPHLSTTVCALIWVLCILLTIITVLRTPPYLYGPPLENFNQLTVTAMLCLRVVTIVTGVLFIKVCLKTRQHGRGKLLIVVSVTLLFFLLLFAFPLKVMETLSDHGYFPEYMQGCAILLACVNSSVNPAIYFLVGRQWKSSGRQSMKMILQNAFEEEEGRVEETPVEIQA